MRSILLVKAFDISISYSFNFLLNSVFQNNRQKMQLSQKKLLPIDNIIDM